VTIKVLILVIASFLAAGAEPLQEFRLPNGLRVLLIENHERPLVRLELRTAWDPSEEPEGKAGLGGFLADVLKTGGATPDKHAAFQRFLEDRALRLVFSLQPRSFSWSLLSDSQGQDGAFAGLAQAATRHEFEPTVVEARRQRLLQVVRERGPKLLAEDRFRQRTGDPSASWLPGEGTLVRLEYQDLLALSRRVLRPERSVLAIYGDMNLAQARQLSVLHLGAWGPSAEQPFQTPGQLQVPLPATRTWLVREARESVQLQAGSPLPSEPELPPSTAAICAWLVQREVTINRPPTLTRVTFRLFPEGGWRLQASANPGLSVAETMEAIQGLLARLREKRVAAAEWTAARQAWDSERRTRVLSPSLEAFALAGQALRSMALEDHVEIGHVQTALGRLFAAEACSYLVTGAAPQDALWLEKAGFGPVEAVN